MLYVHRLLVLAVAGVLAGGLTGALCAGFRLSLIEVERLRSVFAPIASQTVTGSILFVLSTALLIAGAAWIVSRFSPEASGSGIPRVEAVLDHRLQPAPLIFIPIKFIGGVMSIGGGLALGREGPSVQMGAGISHIISRFWRLTWGETRALVAGCAGAGLATAFNAPTAGALFVLEELTGRFDRRVGVVALGCSVGAIVVSRAIMGNELDFQVGELAAGGLISVPFYLALGVMVGVLAVIYNWTTLRVMTWMENTKWPAVWRAAALGVAVGIMGLMLPSWLGGGHELTQKALDGQLVPMILPVLFLFRLVFGALSYSVGTPGGLFAPMLVLGSVAGLAMGEFCEALLPNSSMQAESFALVGMAAFFAGAVRAPLTGLVLVVEMTGSSTLLLPLLGGSFTSMLVAERLGSPPIYQSLGERIARKEG